MRAWLLLLLPGLVYAQEDIRFYDCQPWQGTCPQVALQEPVPPSPMPSSVRVNRELFPHETLAKDTPPLMEQLLNEPTLENARDFYYWNAERLRVTSQVQQLLYHVGKEAKGKAGAE